MAKLYVVSVRGRIPPDLARKVAEAHVAALMSATTRPSGPRVASDDQTSEPVRADNYPD